MTAHDIGDNTTITYMPEFLPKDEADKAFEYFKKSMPWHQDVFRGTILVPRLTVFSATKGITYNYSGLTHVSEGMDPLAEDLMKRAGKETSAVFNSCLLSYYRDERDSIGLHSDDEPELGGNPIVGAISLGGSRKFDLVHNKKKLPTVSYMTEHGSLLLMGLNCQRNWRHKIEKFTGNEPRISLTFRYIHG